jgi:hypothetical protein
MADTSTIPSQEPELKVSVTLDDVVAKLDMLGEQLNWLCENLAGVFGVVTQMSANGGGIRGMMKAMKDAPAILEENGATNE